MDGNYAGDDNREYTQLRWINKVSNVGWYGGAKVVWRDAPSDAAYSDIFVPDSECSLELKESEFGVYPSSYYWDFVDGTKLKKVGNCSDIMEQKVLTSTNFDYLAHMWYGKDFTDGEKTYRYSENRFNSHYIVSVCDESDDKVRFAVYGDTLLLPLEVIDDEEETTETTTTTTNTTSKTTTPETSTVTTTATTSETTTTTKTTTTTPDETVGKESGNYFASIVKWGEMAIFDYESRKGISAEGYVIKGNTDGTYSIILKDDKGKELTTYTIDPKTGKGTDDNGEAVDLPQTGNNSMKTGALLTMSVLLMLTGALAIYGSGMIRRKNEE